MLSKLLDPKRVKFSNTKNGVERKNPPSNPPERAPEVGAGLGNTIIRPARVSNARSRHWCFTLNNYTPDEVNILTSLECKYVFQEETGEKGTPHLQGYINFPNAKTLGGVRKILPRAHWEITKNIQASIQYCSKEESRTGAIYTTIPLETRDTSPGVVVHSDRFSDRLHASLVEAKKDMMSLDLDEFIFLPDVVPDYVRYDNKY